MGTMLPRKPDVPKAPAGHRRRHKGDGQAKLTLQEIEQLRLDAARMRALIALSRSQR